MNIDINYRERQRDRWHAEALTKARESVAFRDEVAMLESEIARKRNRQREIMSASLKEKRTMFTREARAFDLQQGYIDTAETRLDLILRRALPRSL